MKPPLHLVACVAGKGDKPCAARDLYRSDWFTKARAYVESIGAPWRILSAMHGLIDPDAQLEPYDFTLIGKPIWQRWEWGERVLRQLGDVIPDNAPVVLLAGRIYRDALTGTKQNPQPMAHWLNASAPMEGLGIGEQKAWLVQNARRAPAQAELFEGAI